MPGGRQQRILPPIRRPTPSRGRGLQYIRAALRAERDEQIRAEKEQIKLNQTMAYARRILTVINKEGINYLAPMDLAQQLFPATFAANRPDLAETREQIATICRNINHKAVYKEKQYWKLDLFDCLRALNITDLTGKTIYSCRNINYRGLTLKDVTIKGSVGYCLFDYVSLEKINISQATELGCLLEPYRLKLTTSEAQQVQAVSMADIFNRLRQSSENEQPNSIDSSSQEEAKLHGKPTASPNSGRLPSNLISPIISLGITSSSCPN